MHFFITQRRSESRNALLAKRMPVRGSRSCAHVAEYLSICAWVLLICSLSMAW